MRWNLLADANIAAAVSILTAPFDAVEPLGSGRRIIRLPGSILTAPFDAGEHPLSGPLQPL